MKEYERVWQTKPAEFVSLADASRHLSTLEQRERMELMREFYIWNQFELHVKPRIMAAMNRRLAYCFWRRWREG